jgi:hypothetical protein
MLYYVGATLFGFILGLLWEKFVKGDFDKSLEIEEIFYVDTLEEKAENIRPFNNGRYKK